MFPVCLTTVCICNSWVPYVSIKSDILFVMYRSFMSLLIFWFLSITERSVLKPLTMIVNMSDPPYSSVCALFIFWGYIIMSYKFKTVSSWWMGVWIAMKSFSLSLIMLFCFKVYFLNIVTPVFSCLVFALFIFLSFYIRQPFFSTLCFSYVSCKQLVVRVKEKKSSLMIFVF